MKKAICAVTALFMVIAFLASCTGTGSGHQVVHSDEAVSGGMPMPTSPSQNTGNKATTYDFNESVYIGENGEYVFFRVGGTVFSADKASGTVKDLFTTDTPLTYDDNFVVAVASCGSRLYYVKDGRVRMYKVPATKGASPIDRELIIDYDYITGRIRYIYAQDEYIVIEHGGHSIVHTLINNGTYSPFEDAVEEGYHLNIEKAWLFKESIWWADYNEDGTCTYSIYNVMTGEYSEFVTRHDLFTMYETNGEIYCINIDSNCLERIEDGKLHDVYDFSKDSDYANLFVFILCADGSNLWLSVENGDGVAQCIIRFSLKTGKVTKAYDVSAQGIKIRSAKPWHRIINGKLTVFTLGDNDIYDYYLDTKASELVPYYKLSDLVLMNVK